MEMDKYLVFSFTGYVTMLLISSFFNVAHKFCFYKKKKKWEKCRHSVKVLFQLRLKSHLKSVTQNNKNITLFK